MSRGQSFGSLTMPLAESVFTWYRAHEPGLGNDTATSVRTRDGLTARTPIHRELPAVLRAALLAAGRRSDQAADAAQAAQAAQAADIPAAARYDRRGPPHGEPNAESLWHDGPDVGGIRLRWAGALCQV
jgi:hypothetical protein